jgi:uncharacterized protein (TIGR02001 family)
MKKTFAILLTSASALLAVSSYADENAATANPTASAVAPVSQDAQQSPLTSSFGVTSNYIFRGISNSNNNPAVQGGFTYTFPTTGIYLNLWGSSVSFTDKYGNAATSEIDSIIGVTNPIGDHFTYNINIDRYNYPRARGANYNELIANAQYYFLTGMVGYSNNVYNVGAPGTYYNVGVNYDIPAQYAFNVDGLNLKGGIGHYSLPSHKDLSSYNDYNVQISKTFGKYVLALQWTDTNGRSIDVQKLRNSHVIGSVAVNL